MSSRAVSFYAVLTVAALAAGCGGGPAAEPAAAPATTATTTVAPPDPCTAGSYRRLETQRVAFGAVVRERAVAYARPGGKRIAVFGKLNVNRFPTVFGVIGERVDARCRARWYRVRLPRKPNGSLGWVRARDVHLQKIRTRILVDLSERTVTLFRDGRRVLNARAAIGTRATPTPTGTYYVNQRLIAPDPRGPFGPAAIGISSFSEVLTGWTQGGPVAIHGTNRPDLIGQAVSNGCIRVRNDVLRRLFATVWAGTPVVVRA